MKTEWYVIIMAISATGIFLPLVWLNYQSELISPPPFLEAYLIAGFIMEGIILFIIGDMRQKKRDIRNDRKAHTKDLNQVYLRMTDVGIREEQKNLVLTFPRTFDEGTKYSDERIRKMVRGEYDSSIEQTSIKNLKYNEDYQFFDFAVEHLKEKQYKHIYKHWREANDLLENHNNESKKFFQDLADVIKQKMKEQYPEFVEVDQSPHADSIYFSKLIERKLKETFEKNSRYEEESDFSDLIIDRTGSGKHGIMSKGYVLVPFISCQSNNNLEVDKFKNLMTLITTENEFVKRFNELQQIRLKILESLEKFSKELSELVTKLKTGSIIEGKCPVGF